MPDFGPDRWRATEKPEMCAVEGATRWNRLSADDEKTSHFRGGRVALRRRSPPFFQKEKVYAMGRTKEDAIKIVVSCAERYDAELNRKSLLFLCTDKHKRVTTFEVSFHSWNYLHLTGLKTGNGITARQFYERCLHHSLSPNDIDFAKDGTTELKLDVLPHVICKNLRANSIGDFNQQGLQLVTEKLIGGQKACLGFTREKQSDQYIPNTLLKGDIRDHTTNYLRIVVTFRKALQDSDYQEITYLAKNVDWDTVNFSDQYEPLMQRIVQELQPTVPAQGPVNMGQSM